MPACKISVALWPDKESSLCVQPTSGALCRKAVGDDVDGSLLPLVWDRKRGVGWTQLSSLQQRTQHAKTQGRARSKSSANTAVKGIVCAQYHETDPKSRFSFHPEITETPVEKIVHNKGAGRVTEREQQGVHITCNRTEHRPGPRDPGPLQPSAQLGCNTPLIIQTE
eukprot:scaffold194636_cov22-Tisochrysis_lutea.AAC.2